MLLELRAVFPADQVEQVDCGEIELEVGIVVVEDFEGNGDDYEAGEGAPAFAV